MDAIALETLRSKEVGKGRGSSENPELEKRVSVYLGRK